MTKANSKRGVDRRNLLKGLSTGATGVAGVAIAGIGLGEPAAAAESDSEKRKARYKLTDHVKAFYRTNRY